MSIFKRVVPLLIVALTVASCSDEVKIQASAPDGTSIAVPLDGDSTGDGSSGEYVDGRSDDSEPLLVDGDDRVSGDDNSEKPNPDGNPDQSDLDDNDASQNNGDSDNDTNENNGDSDNKDSDSNDSDSDSDSDSNDGSDPREADLADAISSQDNLNDPKPVVVSNLSSNGDSTVTAYFSGAAAPCAGAKATVVEEGDVVEVLVEMGATPEAAYTSCIAVVVDYQMEIQLNTPLAGRALEIHPSSRGNTDEGATVVTSRDDLANLRSATIEDLTIADNGATVKIWFTGGLKECYGAKATMIETSSKVEVHLEIGNPPGAGACNDVGVQSVMNVGLSAPLGDRTLVAHPNSSDTPPKSPAERAAQEYVGLKVDEAKKQATDSGFAFRVVWIDGEALPVTEDYSENRINVAVEKGVVVESSIG